jgi:hypothetical protein
MAVYYSDVCRPAANASTSHVFSSSGIDKSSSTDLWKNPPDSSIFIVAQLLVVFVLYCSFC